MISSILNQESKNSIVYYNSSTLYYIILTHSLTHIYSLSLWIYITSHNTITLITVTNSRLLSCYLCVAQCLSHGRLINPLIATLGCLKCGEMMSVGLQGRAQLNVSVTSNECYTLNITYSNINIYLC